MTMQADTPQPKRPAGFAPLGGSDAVEVLKDGTEILHDETTSSTRWVLYRHYKTKGLNLAIVQGDQKVSVGIGNLKYLLGVVVPKHEHQNEKLRDGGPVTPGFK